MITEKRMNNVVSMRRVILDDFKSIALDKNSTSQL